MAIIPNKNPMPVLDAKLRSTNFEEVALGYSESTAVAEAERCINCRNKPCVAACPSIFRFLSLS